MSKVCQITGKRPMVGNNVSHANNKTKRRFLPNIHSKRVWIDSEQRFVRLRLSTRGLRLINKIGADEAIAMLRERGEKI